MPVFDRTKIELEPAITTDPPKFIFGDNVEFAWCPTGRVQEFLGRLSIVEPAKKKKRTSVSSLLRPKSARGPSRFGESQSRGLGSLVRDLAPPTPDVKSPKSPVSPIPIGNGGSMRVIAENSPSSAQGGWDMVNDAEFFPHSIRSPLRTPVSRPSPLNTASEYKLAKPVMAPMMQWFPGTIRIQASGETAGDGGSFGIWTYNDIRPMYHHLIAPDMKRRSEDDSSGSDPPWEISDIQVIHNSVFHRPHVVSVRMCPPQSFNGGSQIITPSQPTPSKASVLGFRPRCQTFSGRSSVVSGASPPEPGVATPRASSGRFSGTAKSPPPPLKCERDKTFFFTFVTKAEMIDWFLLFRCYARTRNPDEAILHRRLRVSVFDLTESLSRITSSGTDSSLASMASNTSTTKPGDLRSRVTAGDSRPTSGRGSGSVMSKKVKELKSGWTKKTPICLELIVDGIVRARTTWSQVKGSDVPPFWGENFELEDLPSYSGCVIAIYQQVKGNAVQVAEVALPLVSDIINPKDERYPVKSIVDGAVVGELRLSVAFHEIKRLTYSSYKARELVHRDNTATLYHLESQRCLEGGAYDHIVRMDGGHDFVFSIVGRMIDREVVGADKTLFRGNTPLTRMLESVLRLVSGDFLTRSLGPTIARITQDTNDAALIINDKPNEKAVDRIWTLVIQCWEDMYAARGSLPDCLQAVFYHLFHSVKATHHASTEGHLAYKALSLFLFLRLINPALLRPHLFCLHTGLYSTASEKTAKLVARVISATSFFSPRQSQRDPELALFSDFIVANTDMMMDYLSSFCVQGPLAPPFKRLSPIHSLVALRIYNLPDEQGDTIPVPTDGGAVDRQAEMAMLSALLARKRSERQAVTNDDITQEAAAFTETRNKRFIKELDQNLELVAALADPSNCDGASLTKAFQDKHQADRNRRGASAETDTTEDSNVLLGSDDSQDDPCPTRESRQGHGLASPAQLADPRPRHKHREAPFHVQDNSVSREWAPLSIRPRNQPLPSTTLFSERAREQAEGADQVAGDAVRRNLGENRIGRRGSVSNLNMRIQTPGREADDRSRPKTAKR